jgi:hypothetical protein
MPVRLVLGRWSCRSQSRFFDYLVPRNTRDLSHIPQHVAPTVRMAIVEGSGVSSETGAPAETDASPAPAAPAEFNTWRLV